MHCDLINSSLIVENSVSLLTGARNFSLGDRGISLTVFGLFCYCHFVINQDSGLPKTISHFPSLAFFSSSSPSSPLPNSCGRKSKLFQLFHLVSHHRYQRRNDYYPGGHWGVPNTATPYEKMANTEIPRRKSTKYRYRIF